MSSRRPDEKPWRFVTSHTQVLLCIARNPEIRIRDVAQLTGITERAAQRIIADLVEAGYVERTRVGRRNRYEVKADLMMRHPLQDGYEIGELLDLLNRAQPADVSDDSELTKRRTKRADTASNEETSSEGDELAS
jgi:DNA-binding Lrp family transcriptional regulator